MAVVAPHLVARAAYLHGRHEMKPSPTPYVPQEVVLDADILGAWLLTPNSSLHAMTIPEFKALVRGALKSLAPVSESEQPAHIDHPLRHFDRTCPACIAEGQSDKLGEAEEALRRLANAFDPVEGPPDRRDWTTLRSAIYQVLQERTFAASATAAQWEPAGIGNTWSDHRCKRCGEVVTVQMEDSDDEVLARHICRSDSRAKREGEDG